MVKRVQLQTNQWIDLEPAEPHDCPYLPGLVARLAPGIIVPEPAVFDQVLAAGYRRLGTVFYKPACDGCQQCVPIRVPLRRFRRSRSQRRLWRKVASRYQVQVTPPVYRDEHFQLYEKHSRYVSADNTPATPDSYQSCFVISLVTTHFVEYRVDGQLIAVSVLDEGATGISSVYVSWDPRFADLSPGTFSALWEIEWARERGKLHYYLGYWVEGCSQMSYKDRFRPYELYDWKRGWFDP